MTETITGGVTFGPEYTFDPEVGEAPGAPPVKSFSERLTEPRTLAGLALIGLGAAFLVGYRMGGGTTELPTGIERTVFVPRECEECKDRDAATINNDSPT